MADRSIARRWARAFLDLAAEQGRIDALGAELQSVLATLSSGDGIALRVLSNPVFTQAERRAVLDHLLGQMKLQGTTANLLRLLLDKGRFDQLTAIAELYANMADEAAGRERVIVETAHPLTPQLEAEVRAALEKATGRTVLLDTRVRPELIGGLIARVGSKVYDASVKSRLNDIKNRLIGHQAAADA